MGKANSKKDKQAEEKEITALVDESEENNKKTDTATDTKQKEKKALKKVLRYVVLSFAFLILALGVLKFISGLLEPEKQDFTKKAEGIYFFPADYDADPKDDPAYMAKDREVWFSDDAGVGSPLDASVASSDTIKGLMYKYFQSLKEGDATAHANLLSSSYKEKFVVQERFTPQKVHNIRINFNQGEKRDGVSYWHYKVSYEIYENNGTYRADIGSETAKIMHFEIVYEEGSYKINSIGYITYKEDEDVTNTEESEIKGEAQ